MADRQKTGARGWGRFFRSVIGRRRGADRDLEAAGKDKAVVLQGVIDGLEKEWAVIALDDEQRLDWPRERLPKDAKEGMAIVLSLEKAAEIGRHQVAGRWEGVVSVQTQAQDQGLPIQLGRQNLNWPAAQGLSPGDAVVLRMQVDVEDTERRRREVENLVEDLFG